MIGYAEIKESELNKWVESEIGKAGKAPVNDPKAVWQQANWSKYFCTHQSEMKDADHLVEDRNYGTQNNYRSFQELLHRLQEESQRMQLFYADDFACVVGISEKKYILPVQFAEITYLKSYDSMTASELTALGDKEMSSAMLPADLSGASVDSLKDELADKKSKIAAAEKECKDKIEEMRKAFYLKEQELRDLLVKQTAELEAAKEKLEKQIFVLDTQIYGIRCYLGEVIDFTLVRDGKTAPTDTPMVVFQKFRYLDEELGKYFALYGSKTIKDDSFIQILKYRDDIRDIFCGSERSISAIKVSRTGTQTGRSEKINNVLERYEYLHARQIAILIRDGEKLYIGWTDEDRVCMQSEDLFMRPGHVTEKPAPETPKDKWEAESLEERQKEHEKKERSERIARYFLISILQGVTDRGDMVKFPEKTKITEESEYVKFSYAEGWLSDNRFGTFTDILEKGKSVPVRKGDTILTALHVTRDDKGHYGYKMSHEYDVYSNDRGIGEKNRTHGASIPGFKVMQINKILRKSEATVTIDVMKARVERKEGYTFRMDGQPVYHLTLEEPEESIGSFTKDVKLDEDDYNATHKVNPTAFDAASTKYNGKAYDTVFQNYSNNSFRLLEAPSFNTCGVLKVTKVEEKEEPETMAYVSVPTSVSEWRDTNSRVNFQIYPDEYIRINYLCSTWLTYVITTGNLGDFRITGRRMSYADAIKYLNKLLDEVKKREEEEKKLLKDAGLAEWVKSTPDWDRILTEWRIKNEIQKLGIKTAKRFAKETKEDSHE